MTYFGRFMDVILDVLCGRLLDVFLDIVRGRFLWTFFGRFAKTFMDHFSFIYFCKRNTSTDLS